MIGITPSQSARNTLAAGVPECYNAAQFLGHLPGRRGARGPVRLRPGDLVLMDEASMTSTPDLADVITQAAASDAKVILAGDTQQLQAVQNGGGMSLLAEALGYARLAEPVRFRAGWEQQASLRLRDGDTTVLAEYDQHARILGGEPEQMTDAAAAAYLALAAEGTDVLLMAADHALRRELSRRVRDDLIRLGIVQNGPAVTIADGATASAGRPDHLHPQRPRHRGGGARPHAGQRRPAPHRGGHQQRPARPPRPGRRPGHRPAPLDQPPFPYAGYQDAELGYAVTDHVAQGRTVTAGLAVICGTEDRQHAYVALTRGTTANMAYVFTQSPKRADPAPGPRPAPELARYDQNQAGRSGPPAPATPPAQAGEALAVLSAVVDRDGQLASATQDRHRALASADHLAILNAIWTDQTAQAREQRYKDLLAASLPPGYRRQPGHQAKWLWRTMRAAELAGLDAGAVLAAAIAERDLAGARDAAAVLDARLRHRLGALVPQPPGPWSAQVPALADPGRRAYLAEIAAMMDARKDRIGEHAAGHAPPWAVNALGPVPGHPLDRLDWQQRASSIGAWRELSGYGHPADPIGPEPAAAAPDLRAAWHEALAALGPAEGPDVRGLPDGTLLHLRDTYPPRPRGPPGTSATSSARSAPPPGRPAWPPCAPPPTPAPPPSAATTTRPTRKRELAASYQALQDAYRQREDVFAAVMADRADWDAATRHQRHLAVAADAELRRRHPAQHYPPLRSAEPGPLTQDQRDQLTLTPGQQTQETVQWITDLAAQHHVFAEQLADRQSLMTPAEDPSYGDLGQAFPPWPAPARDAILQPPKPEIQPSPRILQRALDPDLDIEAAD